MRLELAGEALAVRVEGHAPLRRWLERQFDARPSNARADFEVIDGEVRRRGRVIERGREAELPHSLEWRLTNEALRRARPRVHILHAACVSRGDDATLIAGAHGAGKTTLALAMMLRHGWKLWSDDVVLMDDRGRVTPVRRPVRVKPGTEIVLPELERLRIDRAAWARGEAWMLQTHASRTLRPRLFILVGGDRRNRLRVNRLTEPLAVGRVSRYLWNFLVRPREALRMVAGLVARSPVLAFAGGTVDERCAALLELKGSHGRA